MARELLRLDLPVEEGARLLALARIAEADGAAARLAPGGDGEALHDFRVALRRLRTVLRAYRPWLEGGPRRRHARKLAGLAASTNAARDAEVQLAWLAEQREHLAPARRAGLDWLVATYEGRRGSGQGTAEDAGRWGKLALKLRARLETYRRRVRPIEVEPLGAVLAGLLRARLARLLQAVALISGPDDVAHAHRARIEGKRLRYLLEPLRATPGLGAREAVRRLKRLQDVLGELHDAHVLEAEIAAARREARGGPRLPALAGVVHLARARRERLHAALVEDAAGGALVALAAQVKRVADGLRVRPRPPAGKRRTAPAPAPAEPASASGEHRAAGRARDAPPVTTH
jgi:CHAD domain-containing protein